MKGKMLKPLKTAEDSEKLGGVEADAYALKGLLTKDYIYSQTNSVGEKIVSGITSFPTTAGVYRTTGNLPAGMPSGAQGYGTLVIWYSGYRLCIYACGGGDEVYFSISSGMSSPPTKWYKIGSMSSVDVVS